MKSDLYWMIIQLIAVDEQQCPLTIRPLNRIGSHQNIPCRINKVTLRFKLLVRRIDWLHPFLGDELCGNVLRWITYHLIVLVDPEKIAEAALFSRVRHVVEVVGPASAFRHHAADIV